MDTTRNTQPETRNPKPATRNPDHNTHKSIRLPEDVAKKFQISGENARRKSHWRKHRKIDLNNITVEKAEQLVREGFPYLVPKSKSEKS